MLVSNVHRQDYLGCANSPKAAADVLAKPLGKLVKIVGDVESMAKALRSGDALMLKNTASRRATSDKEQQGAANA